ncbi:hypothetical protein XELAEV_18019262mg [Xenopus laevis]|uniref:G-protein coupled receptors family 3 profile domain-containing protein n=2 Tax=Xenopus laevis TaxID=8355 RepID=A0A974DGF6_XENLA|nr:hypothetical protein XELAEV_18019262mg [Xenopus laevis]
MSGCSLTSDIIRGYLSSPGDIIIGGNFGIHLSRIYNNLDFTRKPPELQCQMFATEYYQCMRALIFAVEEINVNHELLPNVSLGYQILDKCTTSQLTTQAALWMLSGGQEITPNYHCGKGAPLAGIIGDTASTASMLMAQILGLYRYPQISYLSTNPLLSDRNIFPSFFRTIPSDEYQMIGLGQLISHFGWSWVGLLANDDDYGQFGMQMAKQEIVSLGACVAFSENIMIGQPNKNAPHIARVIKESTVKVVVVIATDNNFVIVAEELLKQNVTGIVWVASEGWATSIILSEKRFKIILKGTIGFAIHGGQMPLFTKFLNSLHPFKDTHDPFIKELWEETFTCKWLDQNSLYQSADNATIKACTGNERLDTLLTEEFYRIPLNVYAAVYAMAWALHNLLYCKPGDGPFHHGACANISTFLPWHLLHYVKNVNFKTPEGSQVFFDAKGNPPTIYDIVNWRESAKDTLEQVGIGTYDLSTPDGNAMKVNSIDIIWANNKTQVPISKCSPSCQSGLRKLIPPGKPICCYECVPCPQGHFSNQTDAVECHPCSWDMWPNLQQDRCLPRTTEFLSFEEPLGYSLAVAAFFSSLSPLIVLGVFIHYKNTAIVRANNYSLSCLLLLSLFLCFLCSLGFIGYPQTEKCLLRQVAFGMVFALCISCVLAKTITVVIAFNATRPGSRLRNWTGVRVSYCVIVFCVFIQLWICILWLLFSPPFHELDSDTKPGVIIVNCNEGSPTAFWCMLGYLGLLATISFIVAFLARRLPDSFNEAKYITFSMLAFLSVWVSFIPSFLSARGMYTVAMEVFAILSSSWAVVGCIFVPKCFIILFRPNMNSRDHLMGKGRNLK